MMNEEYESPNRESLEGWEELADSLNKETKVREMSTGADEENGEEFIASWSCKRMKDHGWEVRENNERVKEEKVQEENCGRLSH